jgi:hypothetical protein
MKIKVENKATVLSDTLKEFFGDKMNLARIKFFGLFMFTTLVIKDKSCMLLIR